MAIDSETSEILRGMLGPMYDEFMGKLQARGVSGAAADKAGSGTYVTPFERGNGDLPEQEIRRMLEEVVRQLSQDANPKTPSIEEFLRQVNVGSPADAGADRGAQTPHERQVYGGDAVKSLITNLIDQNGALAKRAETSDKALSALVPILKALAEKRDHEHKFDEKGACSCGEKKAMSAEPDEKAAAEAREREQKERDESLARVVGTVLEEKLQPFGERVGLVEKALGMPAPVARSAGGTPSDTTLDAAGLARRTFENPTPDGNPASLSAATIKAFTNDAMEVVGEVGMKNASLASEMRREVITARAAWSMSSQKRPPELTDHRLREIAEKHGLPVFKLGQ